MRCIASLVVFIGLCALQSGCVLIEPMQEMSRQTKRIFTFRPGDYRDMTEEETDDWTDDVGREGRGNQPFEQDPDQLWRNWFMSEKARSIERNVGIE